VKTYKFCPEHGHYQGARCRECQRARDKRRGSPAARGYGQAWKALRAQLIAAHPYCAICNHPGSEDNPLSLDHITPKSMGGTDALSNLRVLCLRCNQMRNRKGSKAESNPLPQIHIPDNDDAPIVG
jgi:5-methylcytosine-specific restriction enzyme A